MIRQLPLILSAVAVSVGVMSCGDGAKPAPVAAPADPAPVTLTPLVDLRAALPHLAGWTRGNITSQEGEAPERFAHVLVTFSRGSEKLEMEIADIGGDEGAIDSLEHMAGSDVNRTVGNGYFKGTVVATFPAVESWNTVENLGELSVLIRRRYVIHVSGFGLADAAPMRALAEAVDTSMLR